MKRLVAQPGGAPAPKNSRAPDPPHEDLRLLFENAPIGMYLSTRAGRYGLVNRAFVEMLGYDSAEEVLALDIARDVYFDPTEREDLLARASESALLGADVRLKRKDGRVITVSLHSHGIPDASGRCDRFVGSAMDVTSHREAEERLRESRDALARTNSQLRVVYEQIPAIIWTTDRELRFTSSQGKGLAALGLKPDEVVGMTLEEFGGNEANVDLSRHRRALEGESQRYESTYENFVFNSSLDPLRDASGDIVGTIGTAIEISSQRQLEERLREAQKMEGLALLAGGVAHDFNNLLVGILGNADLALQDAPENGKLRVVLERLRLSAQRASDLTDQLLAYSGRGRFVIEPICLNDLIEEMAGLLRMSISKNATLKIDLDPKRPAFRGDAAQIRQVVMNLITNASDAVHDSGGTICLTTRWVPPPDGENERSNSGYCAVEVADDGCGMDGETRGRIFDPFFTTKVEGHGLGLAAVQGIIRGHGGEIEVESEVGQGTRVGVLFPSIDPVAHEPVAGSVVGTGGLAAGRKVLVVDDEDVVREVTVAMLEHIGVEVSTARNGEEALAVLAAGDAPFDVVLLDMTMPGLSGEETLRRIRALSDPDPPAVILVSGYDDQRVSTERNTGTGFETANRGEAGFLKKPFLAATLEETIAAALERSGTRRTE